MDFRQLSVCPLFHGLPESEIQKLIQGIHYQIKSYQQNDVIVFAGDTVTSLYILISGSVKGEMIDYSGKVVKIEDIEAPKPLAAAFLFGKENKFPVTVTANNDVKILAIPVSEFLKLLQSSAKILVNYLNIIATRSQFLTQKLHFLSFKTIRGKIAHYLLQQAGDALHSVELKQTQQQLAGLFGVTRPSLARVLGEMQREGIIIIERKSVRILDKERLRKILQNE